MLKNTAINMLKNVVIVFLLVIISLLGWNQFVAKKPISFDSKADKLVIVEKIQKLGKLESLNMIIQRDVEITLDLGEINFFGLSIDKTRKQKIALTGTVSSGVDFAKARFENDKLILPSAEIFGTNINQDKTQTLIDNLSLFYRLETLGDTRRLELNELLRKKISEASLLALKQGACEADILNLANQNANIELQRLLSFGNLNIQVISSAVSVCI